MPALTMTTFNLFLHCHLNVLHCHNLCHNNVLSSNISYEHGGKCKLNVLIYYELPIKSLLIPQSEVSMIQMFVLPPICVKILRPSVRVFKEVGPLGGD